MSEISDCCSRAGTRWVAVAVAALAGAMNLAPEPPIDPLLREVRSEDWEISRWPLIRRGQVGIVHAPEGDKVEVYQLLTTSPAPSLDGFRSARPECNGDCCLIAPFDSAAPNQLGGQFSAFALAPSTATVTIQDWDDRRRALTLDFKRSSTGYCGAWIHLFDFTLRGGQRVYLDASPFSVLTFWIRGEAGHERILLKMADAAWERKQDAVPVCELSRCLPAGAIQTTWQQAVVPMSWMPRQIDPRRLATLVFEALDPAAGRIGLRNVAFCKTARPKLPLGAPSQRTMPERKLDKALWVWNTSEILQSAEQQRQLVEFSQKNSFTDLFVQLPKGTRPGEYPGQIALDPERMRPLLGALIRTGVRVHALDGAREYALPEWHAEVTRTVDEVIRYNRSAAPGESFYGIHYDIEPHLIDGFRGPRRSRILGGYLALLKQIAGKTRAAGIRFGVDIPFWYGAMDNLTGESFALEFQGVRKLASEHIIDLADNIGLMDYRTAVFGADGVLSLARAELLYAQKQGKNVFVGLETTGLPDEDLMEFEGAPSPGIPELPPAGNAVVLASDGDRAMVAVVGQAQWQRLRTALERLSIRPDAALWWPAVRLTHVPGVKLSFAGLGATPLHQAMAAAGPELAAYPSFAGFGIHDYTGYRKLLPHDSVF